MVLLRKFLANAVSTLVRNSRLLEVISKRPALHSVFAILSSLKLKALKQSLSNRFGPKIVVIRTVSASPKTKMSGPAETETQSGNAEFSGNAGVDKDNAKFQKLDVDSSKHSEDDAKLVQGDSLNLFGEQRPDVSRKRKQKPKRLHMTFKKARLTSDKTMSETEYYFENGLRKVIPYDHKYNTFCKGRWLGKTLGELYTSEFRLYPIDFYDKAIREGRLLVNLEPARSLGQIIRENDLLTSVVHRHECPVSDAPIEVIVNTDEFFVVNKPCSIPLHPAGRFRHNCLISIMAKEMNMIGIHSIHRLDRMTSGLCIFTKTKEVASKCHTHIRERQVEKEYVCRVVGDFTKFSLPDDHHDQITSEGEETTVSEPLKVYDMKMGTSIVSCAEDAKDCLTVFKCLSTNGETSVLSCKPKTGRTHQIRVHLQYLGFPIVNDPMYNNPAWGNERFKLGPITKPMDEVMQELADMKKWTSILEEMSKKDAEMSDAKPIEDMKHEPPDQSPALKEVLASREEIVPYRPECEECKHPLPDPKPSELQMFLHALRYKGPDWGFETPLPDWASADWTPGPREI